MEKSQMKEFLREAWKEVFQTETVNDDDNFFEIAGDSIKAVQLASWLAQKGVKLELGTIFTAQTFGDIAETLTEMQPMYVPEELVTKDIANRELGGGFQSSASSTPGANAAAQNAVNQQLCDPAQNAAAQQLCDPAQNAANQQLCDPAQNAAAQQLCDPAQNAANQQLAAV